jgi:predicted nucleic acid-binding protein
VIVLDTTVLIDYLRGQPVVARVLDLTAHGEVLATAAINVEEIARGLRDTERGAAQQLFAGLVVLPITGEAGWQAGEWRRSYAARGVTLWQADCLIAATAAAHRAVLATANPKDFPMQGLEVQHWPVGH